MPIFTVLCRRVLVVGAAVMTMTQAVAGDLTVSAAASLTNAFKDVAQAYESAHPGNKVILNFAASDVLLQQILQGAPVDVFASADQIAMDRAEKGEAVVPATRQNFAANEIVLIVPVDNPAGVKAPADLRGAGVKRVAYGNPASVPVGRYTQAAMERDGLWADIAAKGVPAQNVRQSLDYVARGEVEAGFVFATDARIMPDRVRVVATVAAVSPVTYPIALTKRAQPEAAGFIAFVTSQRGQAILSKHGFSKP